ncbi:MULTISPECIES: ABC transporter substrate-binding protein [Streptomyces]|uniref:Sugar ABC transporter substrate-binding protein n=1 Tax=Streptomyces fradiae TaxID=1906 RepID=A0ACC4WCB1_STRFR|nr:MULTISPECIES: extracellular solute-binding protein [Streptomyces]KNE82254.1 sugar ABC transporter substrate-binding protein [Streptomyces fradiae]OFA56695.1 sugar ABC transporter substrate-binding protein [Streptomyces fradiae]
MSLPTRRPLLRRALAALAVLPVLATAACGGSGDTGGSAAGEPAACEKSEGKVKLSYWSWIPGVDKAVAEWNRQNPDIQVTVKSTPAGNAGTYQNMSNALKAGNAPDLGQIEYDSLASFRLQEGLTDIAACAGVKEAEAGFADWTWSQVTFGAGGEDGVWAVPQDTGPMALFYRKDLFEKHDIAVPETWQEYYEAAKKLKKADPKAYMTHFSQTDPNWFTGLLWQKGANLFAQDGDTWKVGIDSPAAGEVADYWQKMIDEKLVATNLQGFSPALYKAWNKGEVATWVSAAWGYSTIRDNAKATAGKWGVAPMPQWSAGDKKAGNWGGSTTAVLGKSKHPYEAAKFALWLNTDPKALEILNREGGLYPAATEGLKLDALQQPVEFYGGQKIFDTFAGAAGDVNTDWTFGPTMTDTYRFMGDGIAGALSGKGTLRDALKEADAKTVESLEKQSLDVGE